MPGIQRLRGTFDPSPFSFAFGWVTCYFFLVAFFTGFFASAFLAGFLVAIVLFSLSDLLHLFCNVHIAFEYLNSVKGKRSKSEELITMLPLRRSAPVPAIGGFPRAT